MYLYRFELQESIIEDFATFCKRQKSLLEDTESKSHKKTGSANKDNDRKKDRDDQFNDRENMLQQQKKG